MQMPQDNQSIKFKLINLISSTRTLMRSKSPPPPREMQSGFFGWVGEANGVFVCGGTVPLIGINTLLIIYEMLFG